MEKPSEAKGPCNCGKVAEGLVIVDDLVRRKSHSELSTFHSYVEAFCVKLRVDVLIGYDSFKCIDVVKKVSETMLYETHYRLPGQLFNRVEVKKGSTVLLVGKLYTVASKVINMLKTLNCRIYFLDPNFGKDSGSGFGYEWKRSSTNLFVERFGRKKVLPCFPNVFHKLYYSDSKVYVHEYVKGSMDQVQKSMLYSHGGIKATLNNYLFDFDLCKHSDYYYIPTGLVCDIESRLYGDLDSKYFAYYCRFFSVEHDFMVSSLEMRLLTLIIKRRSVEINRIFTEGHFEGVYGANRQTRRGQLVKVATKVTLATCGFVILSNILKREGFLHMVRHVKKFSSSAKGKGVSLVKKISSVNPSQYAFGLVALPFLRTWWLSRAVDRPTYF